MHRHNLTTKVLISFFIITAAIALIGLGIMVAIPAMDWAGFAGFVLFGTGISTIVHWISWVYWDSEM